MEDRCIKLSQALEVLDSCACWWAHDRMERIPAADVQPVVMCKDCKYWGRERISCEGLARCNTGESGIRYRNQYDFCSRGEKMEEAK